jgi:hypothetical protein
MGESPGIRIIHGLKKVFGETLRDFWKNFKNPDT